MTGTENYEVLVNKRTRVYQNWVNIRMLCTDVRHPSYKYLGGKGITMDPSWLASFDNFLADVGFPSDVKHTLRRIDRTKNYEPGNVQWGPAHGKGKPRR